MSRPTLELTRRSVLLGTIAAIGSAALTGCQDDAPSPVAPPSMASMAKSGTSGKPGSVEQILFTGVKNDSTDIYIMNADGTNLRRLTTDSTLDEEPAFSPDNKRFVYVRRTFASLTPGDELWTAYTDGSKRALLVRMNGSVSHPRFSPDGSKIVFSAFMAGTNSEIFVVNADGTGLKQLTYSVSMDVTPTWSPDGLTIAWRTDILTRPAIYQMNADGLDPRPLITDCGTCLEPAYSPEGHRLAYADLDGQVIRVFDLDRENPTVDVGPAGTGGDTESPAWTRDGHVVFSSNRGIEGNFELYIGSPGKTGASDVRRLTVFGPGSALHPAYSN